jgi:hypothetical protein
VIDLGHPANRGIVAHLRSRAPADCAPQLDPAVAASPRYILGTHPDIVDRLWSELGGTLPQSCNWILYGQPVLAHPRTGVVFGYAGGSLTYALRLPPDTHRHAIAAGARTRRDYPAYPELDVAASSLDLATFGAGWVFGAWLDGEREWCAAAFAHAGEVV